VNILYLTNGFPLPLTSGYLRHYFFIRELSRLHRITLLSIVNSSFAPEHAHEMAPLTDTIMTFVARRRRGSVLRKCAGRAVAAAVGATEIRQMRSAVRQLLQARSFDAVVVSGKPTFEALAGLELPPVIADMCDATSMRLKGQMAYASATRWAILWLNRHRVRRLERAMVDECHHLVFAAARDREAVVGGANDRTTVVPNGVDLDFWRRNTRQLGRDTIILTGAMNYPPNADAALHLANDIFPIVSKAVPAAQLLVVGHSPAAALMKLGRGRSMVVTGFVDDVRPYLEQSTVFVAPLRFGSGIQNKLLEALAMEVPVVTSPIGEGGLRGSNGARPPLQVACTADEFAAAIVEQLARRTHDPTSASEGRAYVERHFSWTRSANQLNELLEAAVRSRRDIREAQPQGSQAPPNTELIGMRK
jgi:glycosyltransferase involved in cell wall biosynthesis